MLRKFVFIFFAWAALAFPAQAASVLPLYLDEIVADATVAFQGTCTDNRSELDSQTGMVVTYTTFSVSEVLKGSVASSHTIKQVGGRLGNRVFRVEGTPVFVVGAEYVVFLYGVSSAGFSSPVGLAQGQFAIRRGARGAELSNGRDFKAMLRPHADQTLPQNARQKLQQSPDELRHLSLDDFKQIVRQHMGGAK
ncbi:MAG: hypothetical protein Q8O64_02805 [Sideroxyarcus sp.]|nr:hypothetical protein [Sideroxyarcus sp.]